MQVAVRVRRQVVRPVQRQRRGQQLRVQSDGRRQDARGRRADVRRRWRRLRRGLSHLRERDVRLQADTEDAAVERGQLVFGAAPGRRRARQADRELLGRRVVSVAGRRAQTPQPRPAAAAVLLGGRAPGRQLLGHQAQRRGRDGGRAEAPAHAAAPRTRRRQRAAATALPAPAVAAARRHFARAVPREPGDPAPAPAVQSPGGRGRAPRRHRDHGGVRP